MKSITKGLLLLCLGLTALPHTALPVQAEEWSEAEQEDSAAEESALPDEDADSSAAESFELSEPDELPEFAPADPDRETSAAEFSSADADGQYVLEDAPAAERAAVFRLYNPNSGEHFYTISANEKEALKKAGWKEEETKWFAPLQGRAIYRLYNPNASDHHYTMSEQEKNGLAGLGWKDEGVAFYSADEYGRSVYRLYNPNTVSGAHHYTTSLKEARALVSQGWKDEGRSFTAVSDYVFKTDETTGTVHARDPQGKEMNGLCPVYDELYYFDPAKDNAMLTGFRQENGSTYWHDAFGRMGYGAQKTEKGWYCFDENSGVMLALQEAVLSNGRHYYLFEDGHAATGRVFVYPKVGEADPDTAEFHWKNYGWKQNPNLHLMKQKKRELDSKIDQWKQKDEWSQTTENPEMQNAIAEAAELETVLSAMNSQPVHSLYNPNSGEHLYTVQMQEISALQKLGWKDEGRKFDAPVKSTKEIHRLYSASRGEHHYSGDVREIENLAAYGWKDEGICFYAADLPGIAVWRLYNPNASVGSHHFTLSVREKNALVRAGWKEEGQAWSFLNLYSFVRDKNGHVIEVWSDQDQKLGGLCEIYGDRYYLDPAQNGKMMTGHARIPDGSSAMPVFFDPEGRMVFGQRNTAQGIEYYDESTGRQAINTWIQHTSPRKVCWYGNEGYRAMGRQSVNGKTYLFDAKTGALKPNYEQLKTMVSSHIASRTVPGEQVAFALRVPGSEEAIVLNSKPQQSASVMKAFVMGAIHERYDDYAARYGAAYLEGQLSVMISVSDNNAWKNLVAVLGFGNYSAGIDVLRQWNYSHGYTDTQMLGVPYGNYTSAADASKLLCDIQEGKLTQSAKMKALLRTQRVPGRMLQGLPAEAKTGNKPGWIDRCENDTVLVDAPFGTYVVTMLCDQMQNTARARALMGEVSPMVYQWMKENMNLGSGIPA